MVKSKPPALLRWNWSMSGAGLPESFWAVVERCKHETPEAVFSELSVADLVHILWIAQRAVADLRAGYEEVLATDPDVSEDGIADLCATALLEGKARYLKALRQPKTLLELKEPRKYSVESAVLRALEAKGISRAPNVDDPEYAVSSICDEVVQQNPLLRWTIREIARRLPGGQTTSQIRGPYDRRLLEDIARAAGSASWRLSTRLAEANATVGGLLQTVRRCAHDQLQTDHSDEVLAILLGFADRDAFAAWHRENQIDSPASVLLPER